MRFELASIAALVLLTAPALADWEYTKWGMTPEQVASASKGTVEVLPPAKRNKIPFIHIEEAAQGSYAEGPLSMQVTFRFDTRTNGLTCVVYRVLQENQNTALRDALIKRYGPPRHTPKDKALSKIDEFVWLSSDQIILYLPAEPDLATVDHCKPGGITR